MKQNVLMMKYCLKYLRSGNGLDYLRYMSIFLPEVTNPKFSQKNKMKNVNMLYTLMVLKRMDYTVLQIYQELLSQA